MISFFKLNERYNDNYTGSNLQVDLGLSDYFILKNLIPSGDCIFYKRYLDKFLEAINEALSKHVSVKCFANLPIALI
jgi:hypothetical protein